MANSVKIDSNDHKLELTSLNQVASLEQLASLKEFAVERVEKVVTGQVAGGLVAVAELL